MEAANPGLVVSATLPVLPTGLAADGVAFLNLAKQDGARIDLINVMAMDYGSSFAGDMGQEAIQAAQSTLNQARADWPGDTYANIGVTPMIGQNDNSAEVFSEANASALVSWASGNGLGRLAFWSVDRDQPCSGSASGLPSCSEISQSKLDFTKMTGYPISTVSYAIACQKYSDASKGKLVKAYLTYAATDGQQTADQLGRPLLDIRQMVATLRQQIESQAL